MTGAGTVAIPSPDRDETTLLDWRIIDLPLGGTVVPIVEYSVAGRSIEPGSPTVLFLAGGGSSGAQAAKLARLCAERSVKLVLFDLPGHTPPGLLGEATPDRSLVRFAGPVSRRRVVDFMVQRWIEHSPSGRIAVASHSAGFIDASRIDPGLAQAIPRQIVLGSGLPGMAAMRSAYRAAQDAGASSKLDLIGILRTRAMPTGLPAIHFGPAAARRLSDEAIESLQGTEHILAVLNLLRAGSFGARIWRGVRVELVCSAGDRIAPEPLMRRAAERLEALGAEIRFHRVEGDLPHMFFMFDAGATAAAEVICSG